MAGISHIFQIGRTGIQAHQKGLQVTAHNISNLNTKGYSRQEAVLRLLLHWMEKSGQEFGSIKFVVMSIPSLRPS